MTDMPHAALLNGGISGNFDRDVEALKAIMNYPENRDAVFRDFQGCGVRMCAVFVDGMADAEKIGEFILRAAQSTEKPRTSDMPLTDFLSKTVLEIPQAECTAEIKTIISSVLSGMTAVLADGVGQAVLLDTRGFDKRTVSRTNNESVVVGAQEGFVESLRTNLTLLHRYCQTQQMVVEIVSVGTKVPSRVAVVYLKGVADEGIIREVRRRIHSIERPYIQGIGQLQQQIEDSWAALLPQMLETERPDRAVSCLLDGQVALLMDCSPYALIAPVTLMHLLHASDDSFMRWQYGSFLRCVRIFGMLVSLLLPGSYVALTLFHSHLIPTPLLSSIAEARANVPFSVLTEVLIMEFSFYLINEAGTRMPSQIGSALGILGGLVLGQAAVAANIISPIMIIIVALTGLGNYVIPGYAFSLGMVLYRLILIFAGASAGMYGMILAMFVILCRLCALQSFGVPYMAPVAPWRPHNPDILLRLPLWTQNLRMFFEKKHSWMNREGGR